MISRTPRPATGARLNRAFAYLHERQTREAMRTDPVSGKPICPRADGFTNVLLRRIFDPGR